MCVGVVQVHVSTIKRKPLDIPSKPVDFGFQRLRVRAQGPLACVLSDYRRTHVEERLPLPVFIHVDDVIATDADLHFHRVRF